MSDTTVRALTKEPATPPTAVDGAGSTEFDEAMAGAMRPAEGGCQCDARASTSTQQTPPPALRPNLTAPAGLERSLAIDLLAGSTGVAQSRPAPPAPPETGTCGACGLAFSLEDETEPVIGPAVADTTEVVGIPVGWTFAGPARSHRPAAFET